MMSWNIRRKFALSFISLTHRAHIEQALTGAVVNPIPVSEFRLLGTEILNKNYFPIFYSSFSSCSKHRNPITDTVESGDDTGDEDGDTTEGELDFREQGSIREAGTLVEILQAEGSNIAQVRSKLEECGVVPSTDLVVEVLSRVRNSWEVAFTFFLWADKQPGYAHSLRLYHMMIAILGKMRKFDTAWALIDEMRGKSLVTPQTLLIMIRRYCAVHDVGKAVSTFYAHKRFNFTIGMDEFQGLLSALCRYKNVKDAEQLLFCNKDVFPYNTKSFNIILNGWCNIINHPPHARRVWSEMKERGIKCDAISYASMISCYSKIVNLNAVLKLFNQMKALDIVPDRKVYNAVIYTLGKKRLVTEARNLMKTMEEEKGIAPNTVSYNSIIQPLCRDHRLDEARGVLNEMLQRGLSPTIRTFHAFLRILRTGEEVFEFLERMNKMGCKPGHDTYILLIRKFCRWGQLDTVKSLWTEMGKNGFDPDRSSYTALIHGLFLNGKLEEAYKYYEEMKEKELVPEPKIVEMLQTWVSGKQIAEQDMTYAKDDEVNSSQSGTRDKKFNQERDFQRQPETRRVVRERGFSFWET